jgi:hypothetical protein
VQGPTPRAPTPRPNLPGVRKNTFRGTEINLTDKISLFEFIGVQRRG